MRYPKALIALALLAACDEATVITHVDKLSHMSMDDLVVMQDAQGIPVEVHGVPFAGVSANQLAAALRPPAGAAQSFRFHAVPPGNGHGTHGWRLVLHFNPQGAPNAVHDCKLTAEAKTASRPEKGYSINASFCKGPDWQAHGYLQAPQATHGDLDGFGNAMTQLMLTIFRENSDPDR